MSRASRCKLLTLIFVWRMPLACHNKHHMLLPSGWTRFQFIPLQYGWTTVSTNVWLHTPFGADSFLNHSVFAILPVQQDPDVFFGYTQLIALFGKTTDIATLVVGSHATLLSYMEKSVQDSLRCPLDVKRNGNESLRWKPLLMSPLLKCTQCGLAKVLKCVVNLQPKSNSEDF